MIFLLALLTSVGTGFVGFQAFQAFQKEHKGECDRLIPLALTPGRMIDQSIDQSEDIIEDSYRCYTFNGNATQTIVITSAYPFTLVLPDGNEILGNDTFTYHLETSGEYQIRVAGNIQIGQSSIFRARLLDISSFEPEQYESLLDDANLSSEPPEYSRDRNLQTRSYSPTFSTFSFDWTLQIIVDDAVQLVESRGLPSEKLSISLVKLADELCCTYAGFNDAEPRYPASIVKLFWLVVLYEQYHNGILDEDSISEADIYKMIADSDNEPASQVLDLITQTTSGPTLPPDELQQWIDRRYSINHFFEDAGYRNINITQKTFPIPYLQLNEPQGREKQMRGDEIHPIRNFLTSYSVAQLLYEIYTDQAVTPEYSQRIKSHLLRNLEPEAWQHKPFNSIDGFLGEGLPATSIFYSKAGWTSVNRNDSSIVESLDGRTRYILVILGDDKAFKDDEDIFPMMSAEIFNSLNNNQE